MFTKMIIDFRIKMRRLLNWAVREGNWAWVRETVKVPILLQATEFRFDDVISLGLRNILDFLPAINEACHDVVGHCKSWWWWRTGKGIRLREIMKPEKAWGQAARQRKRGGRLPAKGVLEDNDQVTLKDCRSWIGIGIELNWTTTRKVRRICREVWRRTNDIHCWIHGLETTYSCGPPYPQQTQ